MKQFVIRNSHRSNKPETVAAPLSRIANLCRTIEDAKQTLKQDY